jgi:hypothetical protein
MPQPVSTVVLATFFDSASAQVVLTLLLSEGIPAEVRSDTPLLGEGRRCEVVVPTELARKARWVLAQADFSEAELTYYATGELGSGADADKQS